MVNEARESLHKVVDRITARHYTWQDRTGIHAVDVGRNWANPGTGIGHVFGVDSIPLFPDFNVLITVARGGSVVPEHSHSFNEWVHVLSGEMVIHRGGNWVRLGPGGSMEIPSGTPHKKEYISDAIVALSWNEKKGN